MISCRTQFLEPQITWEPSIQPNAHSFPISHPPLRTFLLQSPSTENTPPSIAWGESNIALLYRNSWIIPSFKNSVDQGIIIIKYLLVMFSKKIDVEITNTPKTHPSHLCCMSHLLPTQQMEFYFSFYRSPQEFC